MKVTEFKNIITKYGGPARPNLFYVEIFGMGSEFVQDWEMKAFCKSATFPGIGVNTFEYKPNNYGMPTLMPTGFEHHPISAMFMLDSDHKILSFFHQWMQKIVNYNTTNGMLASINNQLPYELGYKKEYSATIRITFFSSDNYGSNYSVTLDGAHPIRLDDIQLSWEENDSIAILPIQFTYEKISYQNEKLGTFDSRIFNQIDINEINKILNTINTASGNNGRTSMQSIINDYYKIKNKWDTIKSIF